MRVLDLFSGIGGFSLGLNRAGMQTVAFCEIEPYCQKVLAKHWPGVPIYDDIRELDGTQFRGTTSLVCGGFPCQPFSVAGDQRGQDDDRHLWPEMFRVIREVQPTWVIGENVDGFRSLGLDDSLADLESAGYACQTFDIPACGVGAHHIRHRLWIVAHRERDKLRHEPRRRSGTNGKGAAEPGNDGAARDAADTADTARRRGAQRGEGGNRRPELHGAQGISGNGNINGKPTGTVNAETSRGAELADAAGKRLEGAGLRGRLTFAGGRLTEPPVCGTTTRIPNRVDRLRGLGNAVQPQIPEILGRAILAA